MALRLVRMQNHALQLCFRWFEGKCMWQKWTQTRTKSNEKAPSQRLRGGCQALHMKVPRGQLYQQVPANMLPWSHWVTVETQAIWWQMPWRISPVRCAVDLNPSWIGWKRGGHWRENSPAPSIAIRHGLWPRRQQLVWRPVLRWIQFLVPYLFVDVDSLAIS